MEIRLSKYGNIISTDDTSNTIRNDIEKAIENSQKVTIDALDVAISTKSARIIFGFLYKKLTGLKFNDLIQFKDASSSFMFAVNEGILTELDS